MEQGGGEEHGGGIGSRLGQGGCEGPGVGDKRVGDGDGVQEESGVCFGGEEDESGAAEETCAGAGVGAEPGRGPDWVYAVAG